MKGRICQRVFSMDCFRFIYVLTAFLSVCPLLVGTMEPYFKLLHVYAMVVIAFDLVGEKRMLRNKGRILLLILSICYCITMLQNKNLLGFSNISNFCYYFEALAIVYSYGRNSEKWNKWIARVICTLVGVANMIGIWMFFTKYYQFIPNRGYIGMFHSENRLAGLFGNPNVLGMVCLCAIAFGFLEIIRNKSIKERAYYIFLNIVNYFALLLSNSRTQIYSLILLCGVFVCFRGLKKGKAFKNVFQSLAAGILCMVVVFFCGKLIQHGASLLDYRYDYYLQNITTAGGYSLDQEMLDADLDTKDAVIPPVVEPSVIDNEEVDERTAAMETIQNTENAASTDSIRREESTGLNGRRELWEVGWFLFKKAPIFGTGMDNHNMVLWSMGLDGLPVGGNFHNVYMEVLVDFGIAGMLCLLTFLILLVMEMLQYMRYGNTENWIFYAMLTGCVAAFMLDGMLDSTLLSSLYPTAVTFWSVMAQVMEFLEREKIENDYRSGTSLIKMCRNRIARKREGDIS